MSDIPTVGTKAPAFTLASHTGEKIKLSQYKDKSMVVLYFYPRDMTPGCTTEACSFRDFHSELIDLGVTLLGVSTDDVASHTKFSTKYELPFPLLADEDHAVAEKYGVWVEKNMYGKKSFGIQRATFLIGKDGKVAAVWPKVKVDGHVQEVLAVIKAQA
jgi:peroxiredoxin Q/BCP